MTEPLQVASGRLSMTINAQLSGRTTSLTYGGVELLSGKDAHPENWGATYWTSPQSDWGWPPPKEVDGDAWQVISSADNERGGHSLRSPVIEFGGRRFHVEKHHAPGKLTGTIETRYVIENVGSATFRMASWEITRVPAGGLTFFPTGEMCLSPVPPHHELVVQRAHGVTFYDHAGFEPGLCRKLHADGVGGYIAHLHERHLILKVFVDVKPEEQAPGEGECEIFANDDGKYVEVEVQGPYLSFESGQRREFLVITAVVKLPDAVHERELSSIARFAEEEVRRVALESDRAS